MQETTMWVCEDDVPPEYDGGQCTFSLIGCD